MRKFWLALLALGLVAAFSMPAFAAVDGKFSGSLRVRGWYDDNLKSLDKEKYAGAGARQFYDNRLRMQPEFKIAEGLTLTTRFDALERKWGETLSTGGSVNFNDSVNMDRAYVTFDTKGGRFMVGYQENKTFGTVFGNSGANTSVGMIKYLLPVGSFTMVAAIEKGREDVAAAGTRIDSDYDVYDLGIVYKFKSGDAGLMFQNVRNAVMRQLAGTPYIREFYIFDPYVKMKMGPVYLEAEGLYATGNWAKYEQGTTVPMPQDIKFEQSGFYLMANVDLAPMYVGGMFAYSSGDDGSDATKKKTGLFRELALNESVNASLMLMSYEYTNQVGMRYPVGSSSTVTPERGYGHYGDNIWFYQLFAGIKPMKELDIRATISYAYADKKPAANWISDKIGTEFDLTATYKIFDNLEYMVGFGYLWVGDYFKGTDTSAVTANDYLVMHQLTLTF
ncbi:MAG: hypothetical protein RBT20_06735 [Syntrophales bacterium]|jgi:hypothetical protein|nr:hypothetical protein [Syntrophales bacterium]